MQKIMVTLPEGLLQNIGSIVAKLHYNRSQFIREAVAEKIEKIKQAEFEALMAEGYKAMAGEDLQDAKSYLGVTKELDKD
jgi:metal-responsive CopG/Arc/MetJ family transcriptional regulator